MNMPDVSRNPVSLTDSGETIALKNRTINVLIISSELKEIQQQCKHSGMTRKYGLHHKRVNIVEHMMDILKQEAKLVQYNVPDQFQCRVGEVIKEGSKRIFIRERNVGKPKIIELNIRQNNVIFLFGARNKFKRKQKRKK